MKKQNKKNLRDILQKSVSKSVFYSTIFVVLFWYITAFADDIVTILNFQSATWFGSSYSIITTSRWTNTYYVNKWDNSTAVWNYFEWYYYDSNLGYFLLDWSTNPNENVRIVDSTSECSTWYGYKLWWKSYSAYFGFMDFNYSEDIFVYYCLADAKLHWLAYSPYIWFQNFEWIALELFPTISTAFLNPSSEIFVNDVTSIDEVEWFVGSWSNKDDDSVGWERYNLDDTQEATFYIIK